MLKTWMANPDLSAIDIEEKHQQYAEEERKDKYATVSCCETCSIDTCWMLHR